MRTIERDVIVVGAGPGGSVCASYLAKAGVDVLLVDKETFPRDKPCADCQSRTSLKHIAALGAEEELAKYGLLKDGLIFISPDNNKCFIDVPDGYITPRWYFDNIMRKNAERLGAEVIENCWVYDVIREDGFVKGVKAKYNGEKIELRAKIVIGADGSHSIVAQKIGQFPDEPDNLSIALRTYFENVPLLKDGYLEFHYGPVGIVGYLWVCPADKKGNICNVGLGCNMADYKGFTFEEKFWEWAKTSPYGKRFIPSSDNPCRQVAPWKGWRVPTGIQHMKNYDNGVMLIGDAGSVVVPFLDEGVGAASDSAKLAAEVAQEALKKNDFSCNVLKRYQIDWDAQYGEMYKTTKLAEGMLESPEVMNEFIENMNSSPEFKKGFFDSLVREK
jgi:menaquinone-9 beta-reductase